MSKPKIELIKRTNKTGNVWYDVRVNDQTVDFYLTLEKATERYHLRCAVLSDQEKEEVILTNKTKTP
jgi:hypothetical protein